MKVNKIDSRDNPRLKLIRKVRSGRDRVRIFVEGVRLAREALNSGIKLEFCVISRDLADNRLDQALVRSISRSTQVYELPESLFASVADTANSQGIILIGTRPAADREKFSEAIKAHTDRLPITLMLHEVNNPSNLGAVVRTAEAAGALGVITSNGSADVFSPKALRSSMGSSFRMPVWENAAAQEVIEWARSSGFTISATTGNGTASYLDLDWAQPRLVIFGSEAHGLPTKILEAANETIRIPIQETVESLNLAVSAGIILFEARRQILK